MKRKENKFLELNLSNGIKSTGEIAHLGGRQTEENWGYNFGKKLRTTEQKHNETGVEKSSESLFYVRHDLLFINKRISL